METISVSNLKAHLSAELQKVRNGSRITILDHKQPVAVISPLEKESLFSRHAKNRFKYKKLKPLIKEDALSLILEERDEA